MVVNRHKSKKFSMPTGGDSCWGKTNEQEKHKKNSAAKEHILTSSKPRRHLDDVMDLFYMGKDKLDKKDTTTKKRYV